MLQGSALHGFVLRYFTKTFRPLDALRFLFVRDCSLMEWSIPREENQLKNP